MHGLTEHTADNWPELCRRCQSLPFEDSLDGKAAICVGIDPKRAGLNHTRQVLNSETSILPSVKKATHSVAYLFYFLGPNISIVLAMHMGSMLVVAVYKRRSLVSTFAAAFL